MKSLLFPKNISKSRQLRCREFDLEIGGDDIENDTGFFLKKLETFL